MLTQLTQLTQLPHLLRPTASMATISGCIAPPEFSMPEWTGCSAVDGELVRSDMGKATTAPASTRHGLLGGLTLRIQCVLLGSPQGDTLLARRSRVRCVALLHQDKLCRPFGGGSR